MRMAIVVGSTIIALFSGASFAADATPAETNFPRGLFALTLEGDYAHSFNLGRARIESGAVGAHYYFLDRLSLGAEVGGFADQQAGGDSGVAELNLRVRQHLVESGRFSLFTDFGAGVSYADRRTPATGTYFNFVLQPGVGATWQLNDRLFLLGGVRYWHLSNARIDGPLRNPSVNAVEGFVGIMARF